MYEWNDGTYVLMHHGIKGQKWGVRRYQNEDGSLTSAGRIRYGSSEYYLNKADKYMTASNNAKLKYNKRAYELKANVAKYKAARKADKKRGGLDGNNDRSFSDKLRTLNPDGAAAASRINELRAANARTLAKYAKSERKKTRQERVAYNADQWAKANRKIANAHGLNIGGAYVNAVFNTPLVRVRTGKNVKSGQLVAEAIVLAAAREVLNMTAKEAVREIINNQ